MCIRDRSKGARVITRGQGIWLTDSEGHKILDGMAGDTRPFFTANLPNRGIVPNLPAEAILEVTANATGRGLGALNVGVDREPACGLTQCPLPALGFGDVPRTCSQATGLADHATDFELPDRGLGQEGVEQGPGTLDVAYENADHTPVNRAVLDPGRRRVRAVARLRREQSA